MLLQLQHLHTLPPGIFPTGITALQIAAHLSLARQNAGSLVPAPIPRTHTVAA